MSSKLHDLIALAREPSSARRRELLREVTDVFFMGDGAHGASELRLFDDVMGQLASEMEAVVRAQLAERLADAARPPIRLIKSLAVDDADIADPVLRRSTALTEADLLAVAGHMGQGHLRAISGRDQVSEAVSDVIVKRADDRTLDILLRNDNASLSRSAQETAVDRASANPALQEAVVKRRALPHDLLNELYFVVEARLRDHILARNASLDPGALEAALAAGRKQIAASDGALPADYAESEAAVHDLLAKGPIPPMTLASFLRNRQMTRFLIALAEMADIDFHNARGIVERREMDALAIVCKAADFDRALFLTFAILILGQDANAMGRAREYGKLYADLPQDAARRTIRFWRLRRQTGDVAAA